ncbi:MAG: ABC transporter permease subunit [Chloroflexi bacterium]|nr:ABC transporter permease subunit [Chloroflexota bacterium]
MSAHVRAELLKLRSTRTNLGLFAAMLGLVGFVIALHGFGLPTEALGSRPKQLGVFGRGELLGTLFAALLGALSITSEFRHGTIRPTFLVTPRRGRVVAAKVMASMLIGSTFGLLAAALALGVGSVAFATRGLEIRLDGGDYALLLAGSAAAAALWAGIGVGLGALVRSQVPTVVGIATWLLFVEGLLIGDLGFGDVGRFTPGALGKAATGQDPLLAPGLAVLLLALYAVASTAAGWVSTERRDVA